MPGFRLCNDKSNNRILEVRLRRRESVSVSLIDWLQKSSNSLLVPLVQQGDSMPSRRLRYDVSGLDVLREVLRKHGITGSELCPMLCDLIAALDVRTEHASRPLELLFDPKYVFVNDAARLRFVCLPLDTSQRKIDCGPLALLGALSNQKTSLLQDPNDVAAHERLARFLKVQDGVLSSRELQAFVQQEYERPPLYAEVTDVHAGPVLRALDYSLSFPLEYGRTYVVGRDGRCDIRLDGWQRISRVHARLHCDRSGAHVVDEGSTNGVYVEGRRIASHCEERLAFNQVFSLSDVRFCIEVR